MLRPPEGASRFKCPCNQVLMAPTPNPVHVKCPRCHKTLAPPPNTEIFRCPCGIALRGNVTRQRSARGIGLPSKDQVAGGGKYTDEKLLPEEIAAQIKKPNEEYWIRNVGSDEKLYWVRLPSEEQVQKHAYLMKSWETDMLENVERLTVDDLTTKMGQLGFEKEAEKAFDKDELKEKLLKAKSNLMTTSGTKDIIKQLNKLHVGFNSCVDHEDYVDTLVAAVWYGPNKFIDGFVRHLIENQRGAFDIKMVPAQQYGMDVELKKYGISPSTLEKMSQARFKDKVRWFQDQCKKARIKWEDGRVQIKIRRNEMLRDSFNNFNRLAPKDLRRYLRFEFIGEEGIDAGGVAREWFELVTDACFNVDCGLFEYSGVDNICYQFNPASGVANELHEQYFHFLGRVVGKALFDHKFIRAHVTQPIYKHILGYPITMKDIEFTNVKIYETLRDLENAQPEEIADYLLTFSVAVPVFGEIEEIPLKPNGADIDVTASNLQEYIALMTKYYMFERTKTQLAYFLKGIYDIIPPVWLSIFDYRELELLICGLPNINVEDWKKHTKYRGVYAQKGSNHKVVKWFWEVIEASSQEQRALILQYCTGTSRVPVAGFSALQGNDGNIKPFTIDSGKLSDILYPKAHTCFNRIELPLYRSRDELIKRFEEALQQGTTGFSDD